MNNKIKLKFLFKFISVFVLILIIVGEGPVLAISDEQRKIIDSGALYYNVDNTTFCGSLTPIGVTNPSLQQDGVLSLFYPGFTNEADLAQRMEAFIRENFPSSPWLLIPNLGTRLVEEGKKENVNPLVVLTIARKESGIGTAGDSAIRANNSWGNKSSSTTYFVWPSWEASLFSGVSSVETFFAKMNHRITGGHSNYRDIKNLYDYISVHLTGRILYPDGSNTRVFDEIMGEFVDVNNVIKYHEDVTGWIAEITGERVASSITGVVSDCNSAGVVNGSIVDTALAFAWTDGAKVAEIMDAVDQTNGICSMIDDPSSCGQRKSAAGAQIREQDARPEYVSAVKQFNPQNSSDGANWAFSDCGVFVSTVMRSTGLDPNFPVRGTEFNQLPYLLNSAQYDTVPFTDTSQLLPGDILIKAGHIAIYVGPNEFSNAVVVQASWGQNVPSANQSTVTPGDGYYRARIVL